MERHLLAYSLKGKPLTALPPVLQWVTPSHSGGEIVIFLPAIACIYMYAWGGLKLSMVPWTMVGCVVVGRLNIYDISRHKHSRTIIDSQLHQSLKMASPT
jgi:hypothetical protein